MREICVASHHESIGALLADEEFAGLAGRTGFLVELRLDGYGDLTTDTLRAALQRFAPNVVATFRRADEGGKRAGVSDAERLSYVQHAADAGARYVDIELQTPQTGFQKRNAALVLSSHDFQRVPPTAELIRRVDAMAAAGADIAKLAVMPQTVHDTLPLLDVFAHAQAKRIPLLLLAMGEAGLWTRVLTGALGNAPFTFARGAGAPGTAPGQPTWREMAELFRFGQIEREWPVYAVIGSPVGHSLSPLMHNTALQELKLPGVYLPLRIDGDPVPVVNALRAANLRGVSTTIPHKQSIMGACQSIDPVAASVGAVNTLVRNESGWFGTNTDAHAAAASLAQKAGGLSGKNVVILGAGGAARAVAFGVRERGANVFVTNRTPERAAELAKEVNGTVLSESDWGRTRIDVIVNTTPLGMHPNVDSSALKKDQIPAGAIVFDTVYNPLRTKLLAMAEERGAQTLDGLQMFVGQGVQQFELWTGQTAPRARMTEVVLRALQERQRH